MAASAVFPESMAGRRWFSLDDSGKLGISSDQLDEIEKINMGKSLPRGTRVPETVENAGQRLTTAPNEGEEVVRISFNRLGVTLTLMRFHSVPNEGPSLGAGAERKRQEQLEQHVIVEDHRVKKYDS